MHIMMNRRRSILVADNDRVLCAAMKERLEAAGFRVYIAYDGEQASILAARQRFELIFAAADLPIHGGLQLLRHIREDLGLTETPVVICAAAKSIGQVDDLSFKDGLVRVLKKPIELGTLADFVRETVDYLVASL